MPARKQNEDMMTRFWDAIADSFEIMNTACLQAVCLDKEPVKKPKKKQNRARSAYAPNSKSGYQTSERQGSAPPVQSSKLYEYYEYYEGDYEEDAAVGYGTYGTYASASQHQGRRHHKTSAQPSKAAPNAPQLKKTTSTDR